MYGPESLSGEAQENLLVTCVPLWDVGRPLSPTGENVLFQPLLMRSLYLLFPPTAPTHPHLSREEEPLAWAVSVPHKDSVTAFFWGWGGEESFSL